MGRHKLPRGGLCVGAPGGRNTQQQGQVGARTNNGKDRLSIGKRRVLCRLLYRWGDGDLDCLWHKTMKKIVSVVILVACAGSVLAQQVAPYQNPQAPVEERITDLLSRMTLEEKIDALSTNPTVPRLGVVGTGHVEGLHGLALGGPGHWEGHAGRGFL